MLAAAKPDPSNPDLIGPAFHGLINALVAFWPLWVLIGAVAVGKLALRLYELRRLSRSGIADVDRMDGTTFEHFLTTLFRRLGYRVEHTGRRGDYGADLVVTKDGRRIAVQAKRWSKTIGVKAVQEAVAAKGMYRCAEALVVANRTFTRQARTLAEANGVMLWDRDVLVSKLLAVANEVEGVTDTSSNGSHASAFAKPTPSQMPVEPHEHDIVDARHCARCGMVVSDKVRDYCLVRPQRFHGRIYCFEHQRNARIAADPSP